MNAAVKPISLPGDALSVDASGKPVLVGCVCKQCKTVMFPPAPVCPACMSENLGREEMSRTGTLYSFTTVHVGPRMWSRPYTVGYVDLSNGVRVFSHLRGGNFSIGQTVEVGVAEVGKNADGAALTTYVFEPAKV